MKYIIKRPKVNITKEERRDGYAYIAIIENVTILSAFWFERLYGVKGRTTGFFNFRIDATGLSTDVARKEFYVPKMDKKVICIFGKQFF